MEEIAVIDEEEWPEDHFREELYRALVIIDDARMEYNKALAKIQVLESSSHPLLEGGGSNNPLREMPSGGGVPGSFWFWLKVGFAITLPLAILGILLAAAYFLLSHYYWI